MVLMVPNQIKVSVLYCLWSLELCARRYTTAMLGARSALVADSRCAGRFASTALDCANHEYYTVAYFTDWYRLDQIVLVDKPYRLGS